MLDMPGFGAAPPLPDGGRADRRQPGGGAARGVRASAGSSARTSPATRSAAGSGWRWGAPAGPPRSPRSPPPASGGRRWARARTTPALWPGACGRSSPAPPASRPCAARAARHLRRPPGADPRRRRPRAGPRLDRLQRLRRRQPGDAHPHLRPRRLPRGRAGDDRLGRARPPGRPAEARSAAPPAPASSSSPASATRRPGTTPSWSPAPCSRAAPSRPRPEFWES